MIIPEWALGVAVVDATWLPAGSVVEGGLDPGGQLVSVHSRHVQQIPRAPRHFRADMKHPGREDPKSGVLSSASG
jgi:hypothetical protein